MYDPAVFHHHHRKPPWLAVLTKYAVVAEVVVFAVAATFDFTRQGNKARPRPLPRVRAFALLLSFAITLSFLARAIYYACYPILSSESSFIHDLTEILLWSTLDLILLNSSKLPEFPFLLTTTLSFLLETTSLIFSLLSISENDLINAPQITLKVFTDVLLIVFAAVSATALYQTTVVYDRAEIQSLLNNESSLYSEYGLVEDSETDSVSSDNDDDEDELKAARDRKLRSDGGLIGYLRSFKIFLPIVVPYDDLHSQIYAIVVLICILAQRALNVLHPLQLGIVIDKLTRTHQIPWSNVALWICFEMLASDDFGVGAITECLQERLVVWSRNRLRVAAFDKVMSLSMSFHDSKDSGEIIKAIEQAGSLGDLFRTLVLEITPCMLDIAIAIGYVNYLFDVYAVLIIFAVGIGFTFVTMYTTKLVASIRRTLSSKDREASKVLYETVSNWSTITIFGRKTHEKWRLSKVLAETARAAIRSNDSYVALFGAQELCERLGRFAVSIYALYRISAGVSGIGSFVALQSYWDTITRPLYILGHSYRQLSSDLVDAERLLQLFQTEVSVKDKMGAKAIEVTEGKVEIAEVDFAYEGRQNTLTNLTVHIRPGQTVALVGETGGGKSTILKLLMRAYDTTAGSIQIDGQDIKDVTQDSLREAFGFVPQETVLFNTTILENVRYGKLDATNEEVFRACENACIHDKILSFPSGYHSRVGERGIKLSGGERQRIAIARVLLKDPNIVLLDEATSAMDSTTEAKIQQALKTLMHGRTAFVIAHRLSTVVDADAILVIENGRIIEQGNHAELLQKGGKYVELWMKQIGNKSAEVEPEPGDHV